MARVFDDAAHDYINIASAILAGVPISMACRFNTDDLTISEELLCIADTAGNNNYFSLRLSGTLGGDPVSAVTQADAGASQADTSSGYSADTWHHACAVFAAVDSRAVYIDGGSKGTEATSRTPAGLDNTAIGALKRVDHVIHMSGLIAEVGIWDIALTDAEVAVLAAGYSPLLVRPQNLVFYAPLVRELLEVVGGVTLTNVGTAVGSHCPILNPSAPLAPVPAAGILEVTATPASVSVLALAPGIGLGVVPAVVRVVGITPVVGVVAGASVVRVIAVTPTVDIGGVAVPVAVVTLSGVAPRVLSWVDYGRVKRLVDVAHYQGESYFFEITLKTSNAAAPAHARLFNVTDGLPVAGSELTTTSLTGARVRSGALTLSASKEYRVQLAVEGF